MYVKYDYYAFIYNVPNSSLPVETDPSVSWISSRVLFGSGSPSLLALTIVGMSSVVGGQVF